MLTTRVCVDLDVEGDRVCCDAVEQQGARLVEVVLGSASVDLAAGGVLVVGTGGRRVCVNPRYGVQIGLDRCRCWWVSLDALENRFLEVINVVSQLIEVAVLDEPVQLGGEVGVAMVW